MICNCPAVFGFPHHPTRHCPPEVVAPYLADLYGSCPTVCASCGNSHPRHDSPHQGDAAFYDSNECFLRSLGEEQG